MKRRRARSGRVARACDALFTSQSRYLRAITDSLTHYALLDWRMCYAKGVTRHGRGINGKEVDELHWKVDVD